MNINLSLSWHISTDKNLTVDPLLFQLLSGIQLHGSLRQAVSEIGVSYRFAWGLLGKWQEHLGQPLVLMERGRGATLTQPGEKLLHFHYQLDAQYSLELSNFATRFKQEFEPLLIQDKTSSLRISASHDLGLTLLRDLINQSSDASIDLNFQGSIDSLHALNQHTCDIAGFHIPAGELGKPLTDNYLSLLSPKKYQLIYVVKRNQGLIVNSANTKKITSLTSLTEPSIRFINRQLNSGTRLLFDQLLSQANISPAHINGYQNEEFTHMAVAAMVASDVVDVCFGIAPLADKFQLTFIPQAWEHYCLAIPNALAEDERVLSLQHFLLSEKFQQQLSNYNGYDTKDSGRVMSFLDIFQS